MHKPKNNIEVIANLKTFLKIIPKPNNHSFNCIISKFVWSLIIKMIISLKTV